MKYLRANAVYFGPLFESTSHGYDTVDYYTIDRRLGVNDSLRELVDTLHGNGIKVVVDGVFNHVGRDFWAFKDVLEHRQQSRYRDWFAGLNFDQSSPLGDPFSYTAWRGHFNLVNLNLSNREVRAHLFDAVKMWMDAFGIDGLRLDCADCLDSDFMRELAALTKERRPDFWLMGEVVHGNYRHWVNPTMLDAVTNYTCYKGLYSSHNDKNYFEIAYSLDHQFGEQLGQYKDLYLYNFVDNHDVERIASVVKRPAYLYPLHILLFTMPGIPSIYYGSEWGIEGKKHGTDDDALRPVLDLSSVSSSSPNKDLAAAIAKLARIRQDSAALRYGHYVQLKVRHEQFAYARMTQDECIVVAVNSADNPNTIEIDLPIEGSRVVDLLNDGESFALHGEKTLALPLYPCWGRILRIEQ